jgi:hypothetical protein
MHPVHFFRRSEAVYEHDRLGTWEILALVEIGDLDITVFEGRHARVLATRAQRRKPSILCTVGEA